MARIRQSSPDFGQFRPDSSLGVKIRVLEAFQVVFSLLGSGSGVDPQLCVDKFL